LGPGILAAKIGWLDDSPGDAMTDPEKQPLIPTVEKWPPGTLPRRW
jgi:hypothetical protein